MAESDLTWLQDFSPVILALVAGCFTWAVTAAGAGLVFFGRSVSQRSLDCMMGFAAGVMIAASFWSLLLPAAGMAREQGLPEWLPLAVGFLLGGVFLRLGDAFIPHIHIGGTQVEGGNPRWKRATLLVSAITLHNIPEGLAIGVAFGSAALSEGHTFGAAVALAIGIGLQNFPEGAAVALPLRGEGLSKRRSFWYGQLSGSVEPVAAVLGAAAVLLVQPLLPYALAFAAGAMIYVVVEELIPESHLHGNEDLATLGTIGGFTVMMLLDVILG